jgi:cystathionine gamma-synthase
LCHRHGSRLFRLLSNVGPEVVEINFESTLVTPIGDGGCGDDRVGEVSDKEGYTGPMEATDPTDSRGGGVGSIESWLVSAGRDRKAGSPLNIPPWPASNFVLGGQRAYSRDDGTPGWDALAQIVGGLEGGSSVAFASSMAGIAAVFEQLPAGAKVALPDDCYQGVAGIANAGQQRERWRVRRIAVADTAAWIQACADSDLIWLESRPTRCSS